MDQSKRKLSSNQSSEEKTKKLRNEITSIEDLSNEMFYEIFDYLDGCDIYRTFSDLNYRFSNLINSSSLLFKIEFYDSTSIDKNSKEIILYNKSQILSLHLLSSLIHNEIMLSLNIDSSFNHLESLVFDSIEPYILSSFLVKLVDLPRLFSLTIDTQKSLNNLTDVYRFIFNLSKLKYLRLFAMDSKYTGLTISLPININNQFSNIKYLIIDHPCSFNEIFSIISYTSQIIRLSFIHKIYSTLENEIISPVILSNLTDICIYGVGITFNQFEMFITKIYSKLKYLSLTSLAKDLNYLNADRWEELILEYFPQLEKFNLTFDVHGTSKYIGKSNRFNSSFWIERQWLLEAKIELDMIIYSIHPYKKRWFESSNELRKSLTIIFTIIPYYDQILNKNISHISTVGEINHLEIDEEVQTNMLIEILILLPEINSLQIYFLSHVNTIDINDQNIKLLSLQNQITKVYLKKMTNIEQIYFLMELCPRMKYLKLDFVNNINIIRLILIKINNHQLRLLTFRVRAADDQICEILNKMIYFETSILDYTIKRILDQIYLQWK